MLQDFPFEDCVILELGSKTDIVPEKVIEDHFKHVISICHTDDGMKSLKDLIQEFKECMTTISIRYIEFDELTLHNEIIVVRPSMIPNTSNVTCYLSALMHFMSRNVLFSSFINSLDVNYCCAQMNQTPSQVTNFKSFIRTLQSSLSSLLYSGQHTEHCTDFIEAYDLAGKGQQDLSELFMGIMDTLMTSLTDLDVCPAQLHIFPESTGPRQYGHVLKESFYITSETSNTCPTCEINKWHTTEELYLNLEIGQAKPRSSVLPVSDAPYTHLNPEYLDLEWLLDQSCEDNTMDGSMECSICHQTAPAICKTRRTKLPTCLLMFFGRNYYTENSKGEMTACRNKVEMNLPFSFNMKSVLGDICYEITSVFHHHGESHDEGHWTVDIVDIPSGQWYDCNDADISWMGTTPPYIFKRNDDISMNETSQQNVVYMPGSKTIVGAMYVMRKCIPHIFKLAMNNYALLGTSAASTVINHEVVRERRSTYMKQAKR